MLCDCCADKVNMAASSSGRGHRRGGDDWVQVDDRLGRPMEASRSWLKDSSPVNKFMFAPPPPSYVGMKQRLPVEKYVRWIRCTIDGQHRLIPVLVFSKCPRAHNIIFYVHGNAEDLGDIFERVQLISEWTRAHVCAVEYPGYGPLRGTDCNERSACTQVICAIESIVSHNPLLYENVVLYGRSIGSGVVMSIVDKLGTQVGGVILQSPFCSVSRAARSKSRLMSFVNDMVGGAQQFTSVEYVAKIKVPLLIIHGARDKVIPIAHGRELYEKCALPPDKKTFVEDSSADHMRFSRSLMQATLGQFMCRVKRTMRAFKIDAEQFARLTPREKDSLKRSLCARTGGRVRAPTPDTWLE